jgi:hypothetical protein
MNDQDIITLFNPIFLKFNIAEEKRFKSFLEMSNKRLFHGFSNSSFKVSIIL